MGTAYLWVFLGGGLGSVCRFGIARALVHHRLTFPLATLLANVAACLLLGYLVGLSMRNGLAPSHQLLLLTGFCGGFSTFSTFTAESFVLLQNGQWGLALLNVGLSLLSCLGALALGIWWAGAPAS